LNRGRLGFARAHAYIGRMDAKFWKTALLAAEAELEAATRRSDVDAAARKLMRAKAALKQLDAEPEPKRRSTGSRVSDTGRAAELLSVRALSSRQERLRRT
jgi:hypothetical protein